VSDAVTVVCRCLLPFWPFKGMMINAKRPRSMHPDWIDALNFFRGIK